MNCLPNNCFGDSIEIQNGFAFKSKDYVDKGHFVMRISNVQDGYIATNNPKFINPNSKELRFALKEGDILVSLTGNIGRAGMVDKSHLPAVLNQRVARINSNDVSKLNQRYLFLYLTSNIFRNMLSGEGHGAAQQNVSTKEISQMPFRRPPLAEQQRIVAILDEAFEGITAATAHAERNLQNARELFQSVLHSTFSQKGDDWVETTLEEVLENQPRNGWSPPAAHHSDSGIPVLTLSAVTGFEFRINKIKHTSAETDPSRHYWVYDGDFLITRSNTPELVGHVAIANDINTPTIYPDLIMRMNPDISRVVTKFLYWQFRTPAHREIITGRASGANPTMKKINKSAVQTLPVSLPPLPTQKAIVQKLDALSAETRRLESIYTRKLAALAELKQSLLQRAFVGEL